MQIKLTSLFVSQQEQALQFYTQILGFVKKNDIPMGEFRWLTVVSPDDMDGVELVLEPNQNPAAQTYQKALYDQGIPATAFQVTGIQAEAERLKQAGVSFSMDVTKAGPVMIAVFDDTCGNRIQMYQML